MDAEFLQTRIDRTKALIVIYEDAIEALTTPGIQSYTLDTGQDKQSVTKLDLKTLQDAVDAMLNRLATLEARRNGSGAIIGRPAW